MAVEIVHSGNIKIVTRCKCEAILKADIDDIKEHKIEVFEHHWRTTKLITGLQCPRCSIVNICNLSNSITFVENARTG